MMQAQSRWWRSRCSDEEFGFGFEIDKSAHWRMEFGKPVTGCASALVFGLLVGAYSGIQETHYGLVMNGDSTKTSMQHTVTFLTVSGLSTDNAPSTMGPVC